MSNMDFCHARSTLSRQTPLLIILLLGVVLRLVCLTYFTEAINGEGAEYARIAENLVAGKGYVGIAMEGRELMFPPLFPLLIAAASFLTGDFYVAAQSVSFISGVLILVFIFGIAKDLYGDKVAFLAISIAALHPVLNQLSATTWVENLYIALIVSTIYFVNRCHYTHENRYWLLAGSSLGLAYLTCPQAIIFPFLFLPVLFVLCRAKERAIVTQIILFLGSFMIFALPYILFLSISTGGLRVEGKTIVNNELGRQVLSGIPENISAYEVTPKLEEKGVWMRPNADVAASSGSADYRTTLRIVISKGLRNVIKVCMAFSSDYFVGAPLILPLAFLGLFGSVWTRPRASGELFLLLTVAASLLSIMTVIHMFQTRYFFVLIPFFVLWAAKGMDQIAKWSRRTIVKLAVPKLSPILGGQVAGGAAFLGVISLLAMGADGIDTFKADRSLRSSAIRQTGRWLATFPGTKIVMDTGTPLAFHAGATYVPMPWCDSQTALRYAEKKGVNFVVVRSWEVNARPYLKEWLISGVPGRNVFLARNSGGDPANRILVFKLNRSDTNEGLKRSTSTGGANDQGTGAD